MFYVNVYINESNNLKKKQEGGSFISSFLYSVDLVAALLAVAIEIKECLDYH